MSKSNKIVIVREGITITITGFKDSLMDEIQEEIYRKIRESE